MTALTNDVQRPVQLPSGGITFAQKKLAGYTNYGAGNTAHTVYKGSIVACDVSDTDGYFSTVPVTAATGDMFGGIAVEHASVDSSNLADGSKVVRVATNGVWGFPKGSLAVTNIGAVAYASDDNTITVTATDNLPVGRIEDVDATYVWVNIAPNYMVPL